MNWGFVIFRWKVFVSTISGASVSPSFLALHDRQVLIKYDPNLNIVLHLIFDQLLHINSDTILVTHTLDKSRILPCFLLVAMQGHICDPSNLLCRGATVDDKVFITNMYSYTEGSDLCGSTHIINLVAMHRVLTWAFCHFDPNLYFYFFN